MAGKLYIVATPIGNLEDITLRALKTLKEVDLILAEDTRVTCILLKHFDIQKHILSYHQHSSDNRKQEILNDLILGKNIALVTDAGTPGISDPGNELIAYLLEREADIKVIPVPGPSAITAVLSVSDFNVNKFIFLGFMPKKGKTKLFTFLKDSRLPFVFYESPHRIIKTLLLIQDYFGKETNVFVGRELTKMFEDQYRGTVGEVVEKITKEKQRGEIVVIVSLD